MKKIIGLSFITAFICFSSCKKDYNPGTTNLQKASNNWWVTVSADGNDLLGTSVLLTTYNTSTDKDSIWVDDLQNIWPFKCKAKVDVSSNTTSFETNSSQNEYYDISVKLTDGKILPKAGHSKSGVITDSIYMQAEFSDDPGTVYTISGVSRTGLIEDDY